MWFENYFNKIRNKDYDAQDQEYADVFTKNIINRVLVTIEDMMANKPDDNDACRMCGIGM